MGGKGHVVEKKILSGPLVLPGVRLADQSSYTDPYRFSTHVPCSGACDWGTALDQRVSTRRWVPHTRGKNATYNRFLDVIHHVCTTHRKNFGIRRGCVLLSKILMSTLNGSFPVVASMLGRTVAAAGTAMVDSNTLIES